MIELVDYLEGKNIAVIGNASSIFNNFHDIDSHEVIIRMNKGFPQGKEKFLGKRTDIVASSLFLTSEEKQLFEPHYYLYCSPKMHEIMNDRCDNIFFYSKFDWNLLKMKLGSRPSTGCMVIDFLNQYLNKKEIHLYGFDFWKTYNHYTKKNHVSWHDPEAEKAFILKRIDYYYH